MAAQSMSSKKKFLEVAGLSPTGSDESGSDDDDAPAPATKRVKTIDVAALQQHGYKGGPSVLYVPEQANADAEGWNWSSGMERKGEEPAHEDFAERQRNREAVTTAAEESAALGQKAAAQQQLLRAGKREEAFQHKKDLKRDSFRVKEKIKRDKGQQSRGKSTVEEEKRKAREFGVFSGFD